METRPNPEAAPRAIGRWTRVWRVLLSAVAVAFLYANVATLGNAVGRKLRAGPRLPMSPTVSDFFNVFGVFSTYETINRDVLLGATIERPPGGKQRKVRLDRDAYVPHRRWLAMRHLYAQRRIGSLTLMGPREARRFLAQRIRARWEATHPGWKLKHLRIVEHIWRRSHEGYDVGRAKVRRKSWYRD